MTIRLTEYDINTEFDSNKVNTWKLPGRTKLKQRLKILKVGIT